MSMLNKFVAPELKIKSKSSKRVSKGGSAAASKLNQFSASSAAKSGMGVSGSTNSLKVSAQGAMSGGGGGGKR